MLNQLRHQRQLKRGPQWPQCHALQPDVYDLASQRKMVIVMSAFLGWEECNKVPHLLKVVSNTVQDPWSRIPGWLVILYHLPVHLKTLCRCARLKVHLMGPELDAMMHIQEMLKMMSMVGNAVEPTANYLALPRQMGTVLAASWRAQYLSQVLLQFQVRITKQNM